MKKTAYFTPAFLKIHGKKHHLIYWKILHILIYTALSTWFCSIPTPRHSLRTRIYWSHKN